MKFTGCDPAQLLWPECWAPIKWLSFSGWVRTARLRDFLLVTVQHVSKAFSNPSVLFVCVYKLYHSHLQMSVVIMTYCQYEVDWLQLQKKLGNSLRLSAFVQRYNLEHHKISLVDKSPTNEIKIFHCFN